MTLCAPRRLRFRPGFPTLAPPLCSSVPRAFRRLAQGTGLPPASQAHPYLGRHPSEACFTRLLRNSRPTDGYAFL